ncbi:type I DNA topoisomerase [Porcipelethomonas ammoniilytica]|uniref:type I DNA topoisomerase n=1 Tax=Porcipelethomonas TaxID=2981643 RepID=UPI0008232440|nr:type I DNA topoisomerase [Porcipelethomonas ammoniilytica]MCU6720056.1 type I DNA topoisomerase [Porcipelethomonas ammoniilytica]SCJ00731.1 DNA topoisomerase 1 [uncultured Ruminococcus sp.]
MSDLVIVESPAKAKTIKKYLGGNYEVVASMGHVRDLPKSKMGIDFENNFEPQYVDMKGKEDVIKELKKYAKKSEHVYLATDPDREGEAISWHISNMLGLDINDNNRVEFNEITKSGVKAGMSNPHKIDLDLVNAQQARRILDRIVGYKLSPFLWKKVKRGLSAGRVQSVAVRLIVDREKEVKEFVPQEYWSIDAKFTAPSSRKVFAAKLSAIDGKKAELANKEQTDEVLKRLENAVYTVTDVKKRVTRKQPAPPFITSTLQQEASKRMGFQAKRTMKAAQELYEGVEIEGMGAVGLITYMRTDSLRISDEARDAAAKCIEEIYGKEYLPPSPRVFKSKKNAQDAHEAIRPSLPELTPDRVKASLTTDQFKIYKLIWERFIASQMANALLDTVSVTIEAEGCTFKASGYSVKFDGFTKLYEEKKDSEEENNKMLPPINKEDILKLKEILGNQHFTQPPSRFTEASLIKTMEENGIGRPSTYAPTISTIISRMYVERDGKQLRPTALGEVTTDLMKDHFKHIVDAKFTAKMESDLDGVERGETNWVDTLDVFYKDFDKVLTKAEKAMEGKRVKVPDEETDVECDLCGRKMVIKIGRFGKFLACPGFPECKNTKKIVQATKGTCPLCGSKIVLKKSKKGRNFYGCDGYPDCNFMTWNAPVEDKCPKCGSTLFKKGGKSGKLLCEKPDCGYERNL